MAFSFFKKSKTDGDGNGDAAAAKTEEGYKPDPRKARAWFDRATAVADTRQYDYAIECFISGLKFDPDNLEKHKALNEVAKKRKINGGKPAGFGESLKSGGKGAVDKFLHAELLWAKDPINASHMFHVMERAIEADRDLGDDVQLGDVALWVGEELFETLKNSNKTKKKDYIKIRDLFTEIEAYGEAIEASRYALSIDEDDPAVLHQLKDLQALKTMRDAKYDQTSQESVLDNEQQRDLEQQDSRSKSETILDEQIERRRADWDADPDDLDLAVKFVNALVERGLPETENQAIKVLESLYEKTGQYRYRVRIGDIRMRQFNREMREYREHLEANPDDEATKRIAVQRAREQVEFELKEYAERVKNYPTDMQMRFQYGRRLLALKQYDEAIAEFQQSRADPKVRAQSYLFLGRCYMAKQWLDEAVDALKAGVDHYEIDDDKLGKELRYDLMDALEASARNSENLEQAQEAEDLASRLLQTDINYRDIRERRDKLRDLVAELKKKQ